MYGVYHTLRSILHVRSILYVRSILHVRRTVPSVRPDLLTCHAPSVAAMNIRHQLGFGCILASSLIRVWAQTSVSLGHFRGRQRNTEASQRYAQHMCFRPSQLARQPPTAGHDGSGPEVHEVLEGHAWEAYVRMHVE